MAANSSDGAPLDEVERGGEKRGGAERGEVEIATIGWWLHAEMEKALPGVRFVKLWAPEAFTQPVAPLSRIRGLVAYTGAFPVTAELLDCLPALEVVVVLGAGVDAVASGAAGARGIAVLNCPASNTEDVAELGFGLLLAAGRGIARSDAELRAGKWHNITRRRLSGRPIGFYGMGNIGQALARRAVAFDMPVFYTARHAKPELPYVFLPTLGELARRVDQLILAAPATPETRHAANAAVLEALGPEGILVNIARGSLVDEAALVACLKDGRLGAAGLDVYENEPEIPEALRALPEVVLSPHDGGDTFESFNAVLGTAVARLAAHFGWA